MDTWKFLLPTPKGGAKVWTCLDGYPGVHREMFEVTARSFGRSFLRAVAENTEGKSGAMISPTPVRKRSRPATAKYPTGAIVAHAPALREVKRAIKRGAKMLARIQGAWEAGDNRKARELGRLYAHSFHARLAAADQVNRNATPHNRVPPAKLHERAAGAGHRRMAARTYAKPKSGGGSRTITAPKPRAKVVQKMVAQLIELWVLPRVHPHQYAIRGGRKAACEAVMLDMAWAAAGRGAGWTIVLDVRDFYPSIDAEAVASRLPVPLRMAMAAICESAMDVRPAAKKKGRPKKAATQGSENILRGRKVAIPDEAGAKAALCGGSRTGTGTLKKGGPRVSAKKTGNLEGGSDSPNRTHHGNDSVPHSGSGVVDCGGCYELRRQKAKPASGPKGLIQGSPASNLAAELVMAEVLKALPAYFRVACYGDNVIIITRTRKEAVRARKALVRAFAASPSGNFVLGKLKVVRLDAGFAFLGYRFQTVRGAPTVSPTDENHKIIFDRFAGHIKRRQYDKARKCIERWAAQFSLWPAVDEWKAWALSEVDDVEAGRWEPPGCGTTA